MRLEILRSGILGKNAKLLLGSLILAGLAHSATTGQVPGFRDAPPSNPPNNSAPILPNSGFLPGLQAPQLTASASAEGMMAFATSGLPGGQTVTIIDAQQKWMAVYSVDVAGERIKLLSSRPLKQDLSIQYNVAEPTPADIQKLQTP